MQIEDVDPRDERAFAQWFAVVEAVELDTRPGEPDSTARELRGSALAGRPAEDGAPPDDEQIELLAVRDGDRVVGAGRVELPLTDNQHLYSFSLGVLPDERRRGVGAALLRELTERCRRSGRRVLMTEVDEPPAVEGRSPVRGLLEQAGFVEALVEVRRDVALPVDPAHLDEVDAACLPHAIGYTVRTWRAHCPDDLVDDRAELARRMSLDVPLGDLDWREEAWDAARVRRREARAVEQGRTMIGAGALDPDGVMVAFTEVGVAGEVPGRVHQWETIVLAEHRGRRLGTLVKTAVLRRIAIDLPAARLLSTSNAASNGPMIAVNEALGFRPNGGWVAFQRELPS